jgi:c-di-GMP-binding flagellar brake protein YcgR
MSTPARRRHYRVQLDQSQRLAVAVVRADGPSRRFQVRDASLGGASFSLGINELPWVGPGDVLELTFFLPASDRPLRARGSVLRRGPEGPGAPSPVPGKAAEPTDLIAVRLLDESALAVQLDASGWRFFNRRAQPRADLSREALLARVLTPGCSLRLALLDLSLAGIGLEFRAGLGESPTLAERLRVGFVLETGGEPLSAQGTLVHRTPRAGRERLGVAFDGACSPHLLSRATAVGRVLVRNQLHSSGPA